MKTKEDKNDVGIILAKLIYGIATIQYICEMLKNNNKKKVDIDSILRITKSLLEEYECKIDLSLDVLAIKQRKCMKLIVYI